MTDKEQADRIANELLGINTEVQEANTYIDSVNKTIDAREERITTARSSTDKRAISLLGQGLAVEVVATACGVSASYISQLMSKDEVVEEVAGLRFHALQKHNERDDKYDGLEDRLLKQFESMSSTLFDPMKLLKAIQVINSAKRRGQSAPEQISQQNTVVTLIMPTQVVQKFTTNINNQVVNAGEQTLETIQSHTLFDNAKKRMEDRSIENGSLPEGISNNTELVRQLA